MTKITRNYSTENRKSPCEKRKKKDLERIFLWNGCNSKLIIKNIYIYIYTFCMYLMYLDMADIGIYFFVFVVNV